MNNSSNLKHIIVIPVKGPFNESVNSYENLIDLYHTMNSVHRKTISLDFSSINFISANLFAVLGDIFEYISIQNQCRIYINNLKPQIKTVMKKNGFCKFFNMESASDTYHTTMNYKRFKTNTENLQEFERYIRLNIFSRDELPKMSKRLQNSMIDSILEIFNNVIDHAAARSVHVCGQFFPKQGKLIFSIVDIGRTIHENVQIFFETIHQIFTGSELQWALEPGNSTKTTGEPGGLGFEILTDFIKQNQGEFIVISHDELYSHSENKITQLRNPFPGTIVTITINMNDNYSYSLIAENFEPFSF